uniref:Uncharacterized protein n=1 Tax=Ditylenchus dipsaci TaxID=166011 RepID=A0A915ET20_9BILA
MAEILNIHRKKCLDLHPQEDLPEMSGFEGQAPLPPRLLGPPGNRVVRNRPFAHCEVDYFGPVRVRMEHVV